MAAEYPENTMPAFRAAVDAGYDMIEFDPKCTRDGEIVLLHDKTIGRTARCPDGSPAPDLAAAELTLAELRGYDYGLWRGERFRNTPIPTLADLLRLSAETGVLLKLDNVFERFSPAMREKLFSEVEAARAGDRFGFTVSSVEGGLAVGARFPDAAIHYDGDAEEDSLRRLSDGLGRERLTVWIPLDTPRVAWCKRQKASPALCERVRRYARLGIWLLADAEEVKAADALGADVVETVGIPRF